MMQISRQCRCTGRPPDGLSSLSRTSAMAFRAAASLASDFHTEGGPTRHAQLPSARPGRFMRPSLSSRITSCMVT
jgi:hypothetical protein